MICPDGPDPRHHRFGPHVKDLGPTKPSSRACIDCGHRHRFNPPQGKPRFIGRFIEPDECEALGALIGAALVGLNF